MKLIDKLNGDKDLLRKFSNLMYFMNKEIAKSDFTEFLEFCDLTIEDWGKFKEWLNDNGLKTYN